MWSLNFSDKMIRSLDLQGGVESLRSKYFYKMLDAFMTASLRPRRSTLDYIRSVLNPRTSNYDRVASTANLIAGICPSLSKRTFKFLLRSQQLPFRQCAIELMNYGSGSTVFLMTVGGEQRVVKVFRRSLGRNRPGLMAIAHEFISKYRLVASWYKDLVPPTQFLILNGPILGRPAVALVQPYLDGEKKDLFRDFLHDELVSLMQNHPLLNEQIRFFAKQTLYCHEKLNLCLDFLGRENVMVLKSKDTFTLHIIDNGYFALEAFHREKPEMLDQIEEYILKLKRLLDASTKD